MNAVSLLAFAMVGGYAFSTIWTPSLYHAARESGHRLYLRAVFYTVFLLLASLLIHILLYVNYDCYVELTEFISVLIGGRSHGSGLFSLSSKVSVVILCFILGPFLGHAFNFPKLLLAWRVPYFNKRFFFLYEKRVLENAIKNNDFEKLIVSSVYDDLPILVSLETGKFYIGWAVSAPNPVQERKFVRILPVLSGYRVQETQELKFTTEYYDALKKAERLETFEVVLPLKGVVSAHLFDLKVYNENFSGV